MEWNITFQKKSSKLSTNIITPHTALVMAICVSVMRTISSVKVIDALHSPFVSEKKTLDPVF